MIQQSFVCSSQKQVHAVRCMVLHCDVSYKFENYPCKAGEGGAVEWSAVQCSVVGSVQY